MAPKECMDLSWLFNCNWSDGAIVTNVGPSDWLCQPSTEGFHDLVVHQMPGSAAKISFKNMPMVNVGKLGTRMREDACRGWLDHSSQHWSGLSSTWRWETITLRASIAVWKRALQSQITQSFPYKQLSLWTHRYLHNTYTHTHCTHMHTPHMHSWTHRTRTYRTHTHRTHTHPPHMNTCTHTHTHKYSWNVYRSGRLPCTLQQTVDMKMSWSYCWRQMLTQTYQRRWSKHTRQYCTVFRVGVAIITYDHCHVILNC